MAEQKKTGKTGSLQDFAVSKLGPTVPVAIVGEFYCASMTGDCQACRTACRVARRACYTGSDPACLHIEDRFI